MGGLIFPLLLTIYFSFLNEILFFFHSTSLKNIFLVNFFNGCPNLLLKNFRK